MSEQTLLPKLSPIPSVMLGHKDANEAEPRAAEALKAACGGGRREGVGVNEVVSPEQQMKG